jgi:hypothetical protein
MGEEAFALHTVEELCAAIASEDAVIAAAQARRFALIREVDRREGCIPGVRPGSEAKVVLRSLRAESPEADVRLARMLGELPRLGKALAAGEASTTHVKIVEQAVRTIRRTDPAALDDAGLAMVDTCFVDAARDLPPPQFKACAKRLVAHLADNGGDTLDERELERRELVIWDEPGGWVGVNGHLPPDIGAGLRAAMDRWAKPHPACEPDGGDEPLIRDPRTARQRQADALGLAIRLALGAATSTEPDRPHVMIHVRADGPVIDGDHTGPISRAWFARMLCDATLELVTKGRHGDVLNLGRKVRTATGAQRRALVARDRTCVIPGCTIPAAWSDAHHVRWWTKDEGPTDVSNLAMLCGPHHADVHAGTWTLRIRDQVVWAKPPPWIDPARRWRRNTYRDHQDATEQLALDLKPTNPEATAPD